MLINLSKNESYFRVITGSLVIALGSHWLWFLFLPMGAFLIHTGLTYTCPVTHFLNTPSKAAQQHMFVDFLPKHNPQPVFIFKANKQLAFANAAAQALFPNLQTFSDLLDKDITEIIAQEKTQRLSLNIAPGKVYSMLLRGSIKLDGVMVYGTDISEVIALHQELLETQKEIVYAMGEIGETRSKETGDHVRRVAEYSQLLAELAGIDKTEAALIKFASPMHDIGKVAIPDAILKKPGQLNADEFAIMKTHAQIGFELLNHSSRPVLKTAAIIAHQHHEKWNGTGYPQQLAGNDIHIYGRITAVADVFDALSSARVYKKAWPLEKVLLLFKEQRGKHFDPALVDLLVNNLPEFLKIRERYPN